MLTCT